MNDEYELIEKKRSPKLKPSPKVQKKYSERLELTNHLYESEKKANT